MKKFMLLAALSLGVALSPAKALAYNDNCAQGNLWSAASVLVAGQSTSVLVWGEDTVTIMGHSSGATVLSVLVSLDDTNYYATGTTITVLGAADFSMTFPMVASYVKLSSSGIATITASACAAS